MTITAEMKKLEVMEQPEVKQILPYLQDFSKTWSLMTDNEKRSLLRVVFEAIYFDDKAVIRRISAHEPFDQLLGILEIQSQLKMSMLLRLGNKP